MNEDQVSAGAVPDPWADPANWMFEKAGWVHSSVLQDQAQTVHVPIDVKTQRRLPQADRSLVAIFENNSNSAISVEYFLSAKVLVLLG